MATGMRTSVLKTSDEIPFCDPCRQIDNIETEAQCLCEICDHHLCDECLEHHRKTLVTRNHNIVKLPDVQYGKAGFKVSGRRSKNTSLTESEAIHKDASSDVSKGVGDQLLTENKNSHVYRKADFTRGPNVSLENDDVACEIKGMAILRDKTIVSDEENSKLKVFNSTYEFLFEHKCNNQPIDIDKFDDTRVAVTSYGGNLTLYTVGNDDLKEIININNGNRVLGVCCYDGKIYCVARCTIGSENVSEIWVYTPDGKLRRRFQYLSDGKTDFNYLQYITVNPNTGILYVTDWHKGIVALTTKGEVLTSMLPTKLKIPQGIAIDDHGQIYVCGCNSNNLLQISADGRDTIELLSSNSRCYQAQCVKVCGNKLFLARRKSDVISIYKLS